MSRTVGWGVAFGVWLAAAVGSALVMFFEMSDGGTLSSGAAIAGGVLIVCFFLALTYQLGVPATSRPPGRAWLVAVLTCLALGGLGVVLALGAALGAIRG